MAQDNRAPEDRTFSDADADAATERHRDQLELDLSPLLGEGTPANVDLAKLGEADRGDTDWGDDLGGEAVFGGTHANRDGKSEADRAQGAKTRKAAKDQISGRG